MYYQINNITFQHLFSISEIALKSFYLYFANLKSRFSNTFMLFVHILLFFIFKRSDYFQPVILFFPLFLKDS